MPAYNSRLKEVQFLGINLWCLGGLFSLLISSVLVFIFLNRADYKLVSLFAVVGLIALVMTLVCFRYNNKLFELNFLSMTHALKVRTEKWMCKKGYDHDAL